MMSFESAPLMGCIVNSRGASESTADATDGERNQRGEGIEPRERNGSPNGQQGNGCEEHETRPVGVQMDVGKVSTRPDREQEQHRNAAVDQLESCCEHEH